jgi:hypothetical protein
VIISATQLVDGSYAASRVTIARPGARLPH